jgi:amino acid permease
MHYYTTDKKILAARKVQRTMERRVNMLAMASYIGIGFLLGTLVFGVFL